VLDIDRERQRISLGLKQTQEDPWQRVVDTYNLGDELEGKVTKVVSFGAFVEILDGVEGLVHISELANHHVENPREVVNQGDVIRVKILEIDSERRRLSLSAKRVEDQVLPLRSAADVPGPGTHVEGELTGDEELGEVRDLGLSEDVFAPGGDPTETGEGTAAEEQVEVAEALDVDQTIPSPEAAADAVAEDAPADEAPAEPAEPEAPAEPAEPAEPESPEQPQ
jgi:small subunit ribosomal protein S1